MLADVCDLGVPDPQFVKARFEVVSAPFPLDPPRALRAILRETGRDFTVLSYNVKGLPWPIAKGRNEALREIGRELGRMRREDRQPDVVLIQEGFTRDIEALMRESGYAYRASGPKPQDTSKSNGLKLDKLAMPGPDRLRVLGAGLHVLSDWPIQRVWTTAFRSCAGIDCFANKGAMMVRIQPDGAPTPIDIVNTHLNSKKAARSSTARTLAAHQGQTMELHSFIARHRSAAFPLVAGGDYNVRNAPARYDYAALERPYTVVSEYCAMLRRECLDEAHRDKGKPWLATQDLQAFSDGAVRIRPTSSTWLFAGGASGRVLSDHPAYSVRYRMTWNPDTVAGLQQAAGVRPARPCPPTVLASNR